MHFKSSEVHLHVKDRKAIYTGGDEIQGILTLNLYKALKLKGITVNLECVAQATVLESVGDTFVNHDLALTIYSAPFSVFPAEGVEADENGLYEIEQGIHRLPFEFTFPTDSNLPASMHFDGKGCSIIWRLNSKIDRPEVLRVSGKTKKPLFFVPAITNYDPSFHPAIEHHHEMIKTHFYNQDSTSSMTHSMVSLLSGHYKDEAQIDVHVYVPHTGIKQWPFPSGLNMTFKSSVGDLVLLKKVKMSLDAYTMATVEDHYQSYLKRRYEILSLEPNVVIENDIEHLSSFYGNDDGLRLPVLLDQSVDVSTVHRKYRLCVQISLDSKYRRGHSKTYTFKLPVHVSPLSGLVFAGREELPANTPTGSVDPLKIPFPFDAKYLKAGVKPKAAPKDSDDEAYDHELQAVATVDKKMPPPTKKN